MNHSSWRDNEHKSLAEFEEEQNGRETLGGSYHQKQQKLSDQNKFEWNTL